MGTERDISATELPDQLKQLRRSSALGKVRLRLDVEPEVLRERLDRLHASQVGTGEYGLERRAIQEADQSVGLSSTGLGQGP